MATVKQFVRAYGAAVKRAERDQQRRAKEAAKNYKAQLKARELTNASEAVRQYEEYVEIIRSLHKNCTGYIAWEGLAREAKPLPPEIVASREELAKNNLINYRPSFFVKLFNLTNKRIEGLKRKVQIASLEDKKENERRIANYNKEKYEWDQVQDIVTKVLSKDPEGYRLAIEYFKPFDDIKELGSEISLSFQSNTISVDIKIKGPEIIPNYSLKQTSTGKLSKKELPQAKFNELYQDYVCSAVLRISRELLAYFEVDFIVVNALSELLNTQTGLIEDQVILSVAVPPETLDKLYLNNIDPSDSMKNFSHNMKFIKTSGFVPVERVSIEKFI
ncbi:MAG: hypothetical protein ACJ76F_13420 [Bacteroidia bacterium]